MEKYFKRKGILVDQQESTQETKKGRCDEERNMSKSKQQRLEFDFENLIVDPGLRKEIKDYHPNDYDKIRKAYLLKGPFQPRNHIFPHKKIANQNRRFNPDWFDKYPFWLEYSIEKDAAFCLCCYLFNHKDGKQGGGGAFVRQGFSNWNKIERLLTHVGGPHSAHNEASRKCIDLLNQKQSIQVAIIKQTDNATREYQTRLEATVDCVRFLLQQGSTFRGHDENKRPHNQGNFLELLNFLACHNKIIDGVVLNNAPENNQLLAHTIQKNIVNVAAVETTNAIIKDLGDEPFSILVVASRDMSNKEKIAVVLRYVDSNGSVVERFLGMVHVIETTVISLKAGIEQLLAKHGLSLSRLRGQWYDGANSMRCEFNGLKSLILKENQCAFYVHCFAHELQLNLVSVAMNHNLVVNLFMVITKVVNIVGSSCKCRDKLHEIQANKIMEALNNDEISSGRSLNQETGLQRLSDSRWGSHYGTLLNLIVMFSSAIDVLDFVSFNGLNPEQRVEAGHLLGLIQSFEFIFTLHLMKTVLGITNELSQALQKKDQNIVNILKLVHLAKERLQQMRDDGWESLLMEVSSFCVKFDVDVLNMDSTYVVRGRARRHTKTKLCLHHYRVDLFHTMIDMQVQELNNHFSESSTELFMCTTCLDPSDSFSAFDKQKLIRLAKLYPVEFSSPQILMMLDNQLETYILDIRSSDYFSNVKGIAGLAKKLVETKRDLVYPLVYLLLKLALTLPVATKTVERLFFGMKSLKDRLRNQMRDERINDYLVIYMEKDVFSAVKNEAIMQTLSKYGDL